MNPKVVQTLIEMLQDRGYVINETETIQGVKGSGNIKVYHCDSLKIGIKSINEIIEDMEENDIKNGIFVYSGIISSFAKQLLTDNHNLEFFHEDEVSFNITHHSFVPEHVIVSEDIKKIILKKYHISSRQLPCILKSDPVAKYHGGCVGDLFKIIRDTKDGLSINYRICV